MDAIIAGGRGGGGYADYVYVPDGYDDDSRDISKFTVRKILCTAYH